ncbi:hypothetical protein [Streptomyces lydicus]|uniref:hypothetical protein n=1 Tax=Streptomyces lydicus TaxID=47763 RepID=UPI00378F69EF
MSRRNAHQSSQDDDANTTGAGVTLLILSIAVPSISIAALFIYSFSGKAPGATALITGLMTSMSSAAAGAFLGFLFGVPRTLERKAKAGNKKSAMEVQIPAGAEQEFAPNTNLEQISDWLTKIIVGVGLIKIGTSGGPARRLIAVTSGGMGGGQAATTIAASLIITFTVWGFMNSYLLTYMKIPSAFRWAYGGIIKKIKERPEIDARAIEVVNRVLNPPWGTAPAPQDALDVKVREATEETRIWIFHIVRDVLSPPREEAKIRQTVPVLRALMKAVPDYHQYRGYLGIALATKSEPDWAEAEKMLTEAIEGRATPEEGWLNYEYQRVRCRINLQREREGIIQDLRILKERALNEFLRLLEDPDVKAWIESNQIDKDNLPVA